MSEYTIESKPASKNAWFTPQESNNYYKTRYAREGVTIHWWGGGEQEDKHDNIVSYFERQSQAGVKSVNFVVSDKKITKMVDDENVAWCSNEGNPTTISIECEPGLSDQGYKHVGWLVASLEKKYGKKLSLYPHKKWLATACPGVIDINRVRQEADAASGGALPAPAPVPAPTPATPAPSAANETVHLPSAVQTWAAYKVGSGYRKGTADQVGTLLPSKFGGLTYKIVQNLGNVVVIDTEAFGRVAIWVQGTEAIVRAATQYAQAVPVTASGTVTFPASVASWAVYKVGSGYRKGTSDQVGSILPAQYGGLTYPIIENLGNVVVIDTEAFGRVAAWIKDTEALIK